MREMYIDEFGRPVSPSMASQYSPPHEHMVPSWPLPPVLPFPNTNPMSPPYENQAQAGSYPHPPNPQFIPHPHFFPVYFGHPGPMGPPPTAMGSDGPHMASQPGMWYQPPEGSVVPPFAQVNSSSHNIAIKLMSRLKVKMSATFRYTLLSPINLKDLPSSPRTRTKSRPKSKPRLNSLSMFPQLESDPLPFPLYLPTTLSKLRATPKAADRVGVVARMGVD